ncbi:DUF6653 family protein [Roseibium litorale]|nr:DUF6653 family protein [Roseibium litorale]
MTAKVWRRHVSPWSVHTRMATLPFLLASLASHAWIGTPAAAGLTLIVFTWLLVSPRLFPAPTRFDTWIARSAFGERIWINRMAVPIPQDEARAAMRLSLVTGLGFATAVYGAITINPLLAVTGMIVTYAGKLVFLNRMALLYDRMRDAHPLYRFWSTAPDNDNPARKANRKVPESA